MGKKRTGGNAQQSSPSEGGASSPSNTSASTSSSPSSAVQLPKNTKNAGKTPPTQRSNDHTNNSSASPASALDHARLVTPHSFSLSSGFKGAIKHESRSGSRGGGNIHAQNASSATTADYADADDDDDEANRDPDAFSPSYTSGGDDILSPATSIGPFKSPELMTYSPMKHHGKRVGEGRAATAAEDGAALSPDTILRKAAEIVEAYTNAKASATTKKGGGKKGGSGVAAEPLANEALINQLAAALGAAKANSGGGIANIGGYQPMELLTPPSMMGGQPAFESPVHLTFGSAGSHTLSTANGGSKGADGGGGLSKSAPASPILKSALKKDRVVHIDESSFSRHPTVVLDKPGQTKAQKRELLHPNQHTAKTANMNKRPDDRHHRHGTSGGGGAPSAIRTNSSPAILRSSFSMGRFDPLALSQHFHEQIGSPMVKATKQLVKPKRNWLILCLIIIIAGLCIHQRPELPAGLIVDDPFRPGTLFNQSNIKVKRPIVMVPGFITSAIEVWESDECGTTYGTKGTLFRERMFGSQMILHLLNRPQCFMRQFGLHPTRYGDDPEPANASSGRRVKSRPAGWLDSADYFVPGFWVWAKLIRNFADIGYDPTSMMLYPYDWRLNSGQMEKRDGYFHRLKFGVEEQYRLANNTQVVFISHSYGSLVKTDFMNWAEKQEKGWADKYVHSSVFIGAPMLGIPKAMSALISGEMKDLTSLPSVARLILNVYLPRYWRTEAFRSWPCLEAMLPRGPDALWPNVLSLFNQSVTLRASDGYEIIQTVSEQAGQTGLTEQIKQSKLTAHQGPHLPKADKMGVYVLYGTGIATEVGYGYTLDEDDVGGAAASATEARGSLFLDAFNLVEIRKFFADVGAKQEEGEWEKDLPQSRRSVGGRSSGDSECANINAPATGVAAGGAHQPHNKCDNLRGSMDPTFSRHSGSRLKDAAEEVAAKKSWMQYVASLGTLVKEMTTRALDSAATETDADENDNCSGPQNTTGDSSSSEKDSITTANTTLPFNNKHGIAHQRTPSHVPPRGALWNMIFLGNRTTGNALVVDTSLNNVKVAPAVALESIGIGKGGDGDSGSAVGGTAPSPDGLSAEGDMLHDNPKEGLTGIPTTGIKDRKDNFYSTGVLQGLGDGTVPLISLGYMARSEHGWRKDVKKIVTREYMHLHTPEAHDKLEMLMAEARRRKKGLETATPAANAKSKQQQVATAVVPVGGPDAPSSPTTSVPFTQQLTRLLDFNITNISTADIEEYVSSAATTLYNTTDSLYRSVKEGVENMRSALDLRGGGASTDHVDIMGNYEMITDIMNIVTGNEHLVKERIFTDIDERITQATGERAGGTGAN